MSASTQKPANSSEPTWPNFFIVGEPRSGTTTLHDWMSQHTDIYMSSVKEPHYFSKIEFPSPDNEVLHITRDTQTYLKLFSSGKDCPVRGESSTYYLADPAAPRLISETVPTAKLIAVLRDPIERAYSHYLLYNRRGKQKLSFYETIQRDITKPEDQNLAHNLVELGRYHKHISNYLQYFPQNQLLVLLFDDLHNHPKETMAQIFDFLGVEAGQADDIDTGKAQNTYQQPRNELLGKLMANKHLTSLGLKILPRPLLQQIRNEILLIKSTKPPLDPAAKKMLQETYEPEINKLETLLNRDFSALRKTWQ